MSGRKLQNGVRDGEVCSRVSDGATREMRRPLAGFCESQVTSPAQPSPDLRSGLGWAGLHRQRRWRKRRCLENAIGVFHESGIRSSRTAWGCALVELFPAGQHLYRWQIVTSDATRAIVILRRAVEDGDVSGFGKSVERMNE